MTVPLASPVARPVGAPSNVAVAGLGMWHAPGANVAVAPGGVGVGGPGGSGRVRATVRAPAWAVGSDAPDPAAEVVVAAANAVQVSGTNERVVLLERFAEDGHEAGLGVGHVITFGPCSLPCPGRTRSAPRNPKFFFGLPTGQRGGKPRAGETPVPVSGSVRQVECACRFAQRHPDEEPQLHQFGGDRIVLRQPVEGVIEFEQIVIGGGGEVGESVQIDPVPPAAALDPVPVAGVVDQDAPHGLGCGGEEVPATIKVLVPDETQVRLMALAAVASPRV